MRMKIRRPSATARTTTHFHPRNDGGTSPFAAVRALIVEGVRMRVWDWRPLDIGIATDDDKRLARR